MRDYAKGLLEERARAWEQAKEILDRCATEKRERTAEEDEMYARANGDIERLGRLVDEWTVAEKQRQELDEARSILEHVARPATEVRAEQTESGLEQWFRTGDTSGLPASMRASSGAINIDLKPAAQFMQAVRDGMDRDEARAIYTDGGASAGSIVVPEQWSMQLYQYIEAESAIRRLAYVFTTSDGSPMHFEKVATHGIGTQVSGQGTAIGGTDPVLGTLTLNAFRYGQLVKVSTQAARDTGFDLLGFVARNIGRALGRITDTAYVTGNGTSAPNGLITAASVGATTGGSLIALGGGAAANFTQTLDCLITLQHSVVDSYRTRGQFVMNDSTAGTVRKVRDGGAGTIGGYLWAPATSIDAVTGLRQPDMLFGSPVYTDTNYGTNGSAVKPVSFGDHSAYYIRDVGAVRLERSDERYFDTDEIGFRGLMETDGDLIDTGAVKVLQQAV